MSEKDHAVLTDVTSMWSVLSVMGPRAQELLRRVSPDDLSPDSLKFSWTREIDLGHARVRAARMSYVGGPGYELYVPVEMSRHVYLTLQEAGADLGLRDAGYYALDALRIEQGRRAWGAELGPDETPWEAGLASSVRLDKSGFLGRDALIAKKDQPLRKRLIHVVFKDAAVYAWGGEPISITATNGEQTVGELTSVGWSPLAGACVGLGYLRGVVAQERHRGTRAHVHLWGEPTPVALYDHWPYR